MDNNLNRFEQTAVDAKNMVWLQWDQLKLRMVDSLANLFNNIFAVFVIVLLACFALIFLAIALIIAVASLVGSYLYASLIMAGLFIIATLIVYATRRKLIVNPMVRMFAKTFFEPDNDDDYDQ